MRTIKFRGKNINKNEWVNGDLVVVEDGMHNVVRAKIITHCFAKSFQGGGFDHYSISTLVKPETIGQFTGLTDKDGAEIYEGDIVELREPNGMPNICKVEMCEKGYWCVSFGIHERIILGFIDKNQITVIGNIHDNPELLKNNNAQTN